MELIAQKREKTGKKVKTLRQNGEIPAVLFGYGIEPTSINLNFNSFTKVFSQAGETSLIDLVLDNQKPSKVLVKEIQYSPINNKIIHAALYKPNLMENVEAEVPVEIIGEETNPLLKSGEGIVLLLINEVRVKSLPTDIPHKFTIDISGLVTIGEGITVGQLAYDREKVEILDVEENELVLKIDNAQMQEEVEETTMTEEEAIAKMEATGEKPEEEGEEGEGKEEK